MPPSNSVRLGQRRGRHTGFLRFVLLALLLVGAAWWLKGAFTLAPSPTIQIESDRPAIGAATKIKIRFSEPERGLGEVKLEAIQGQKQIVLGSKSFDRASVYALRRGTVQADYEIETTLGRGTPGWLAEGELTLRATATRIGGAFRTAAPLVVEKKLAVRLRPPRLELLSQQHYLRQGGSGVVLLRVGDHVARSGVRVGTQEFHSFPSLAGEEHDRFTLFGVPWNHSDPASIKIFAEDDAGNRVELPFVTLFKAHPPRRDTIELTDSFLQAAVPSIAAQTPGLDASGTLLEQYVRINGTLRQENLKQIAELSRGSAANWLIDGPFLQLPNSARRAGYGEVRTYRYQGRNVDQKTHLGLDLAATARAAVPAANSGKVAYAGFFGIYGNAVIIDHGRGLFSLNGHLSSIEVKVGDTVRKGQTVGHSGSTGLAGGDHLHLEIYIQGVSVDPVEWLDGHWIRDNVATKLPVPGV